MKKTIQLVLICSFFCVTAMAQSRRTDPTIGLGVDFALPLGSFGDEADFGFGASLLFQQPIAEALRFSVSAGYLRFSGGETFAGLKYREGYAPLKVGLKYFLTANIYGAAEAGVAISTANGSGSGTAFAYSPGLGVELPLLKGNSLDIDLRYEGWTRSNGTRSFASLRAGFNF